MASAIEGSIPKCNLLQLIECSICAETFTDPRVLPCQHTFCLQCLQSTEGPHVGLMLCALCRRQFSIPRNEGLAGLTRDFKVQSLIELYNSNSPDIAESEGFSCRLHPTRTLDVFCFDCKRVTCSSCRLQSHSSHRTSDFGEVAGGLRRRIAKEIAQLDAWSEETATKKTLMTDRLTPFVTDIASAELEIIRHSDELIQRIENHRCTLLSDLRIAKQKRLEELEKAVKESDDHRAILESLSSFYSNIRSYGTPAEICQAANVLPTTVSELLGQQIGQTERLIPLGNVVFWESDLDEFDKAANVVGAVQVVNQVNLDRSAMITMPGSVCGVATMNGNIFVLCRQSKSVRIYQDKSPYALDRQLSLWEIRDPWDMAASPPSNSLYVTDQFSQCVWKISDPLDVDRSGWLGRVAGNWMTRWWTGKDRQIIRWVTGISCPYTISVSSDGMRVLIPRQGQPCCVDIYGQDGTGIQRLMLTDDVESIRHAVETPRGNLVVSLRWRTAGRWGVCQVNRDGQILHRFAAKNARQQTLDEKSMLHIAVDAEESVFVADYSNKRVIRFDSELNWIGIALSKDGGGGEGIQEPYRLCCDQDKKRLFVGQTDGIIGLYNISCN